MYESPIKIFYSDIRTQLIEQQEDNIYKAIQSYGIVVDKEELLKALKYDREQYEKGYEDGIRDFAKKLVEHYFYDLERFAIFDEDIINFADKMTNS